MDYKTINRRIFEGKDVPSSILKNKSFYQYLLNNGVAYYYSKYLCANKTDIEKQIIRIGDKFNKRYTKTLELINRVCKTNGIEFLLFKTFKYLPEVVDGDIDIFVKAKDYFKLLRLLERTGFDCMEEHFLKAACQKDGFSKIEPRVHLSFHSYLILKSDEIWHRTETAKVETLDVVNTSREVDLLSLLLNILYGPNFLKLYVYLLYKGTEIKKVYDLPISKKARKDLDFLMNRLDDNRVLDVKFPFFPNTRSFIVWWFENVLLNPDFGIIMKLKHISFFFFSKYRYIFFCLLPFRKDWKIKYA